MNPPTVEQYREARRAARSEGRRTLALVLLCGALLVAGLINVIVGIWRQL